MVRLEQRDKNTDPLDAKVKVINLWAGPGAGKSTLGAGLFHKMKSAGETVELVTEYAKELVYENNPLLTNNLQILAEQDMRLRRLEGKVEYAITDSPLPLTVIYSKPPFDEDWFFDAAWGAFDTYDNINFYVVRDKPYYTYGRYQTEEEARKLDRDVLLRCPKHFNVFGNAKGVEDAYEYIKQTRA